MTMTTPTTAMRKPGGDVSELLSMMLHIADTNAAEYRSIDKRPTTLVTAALLEKQEWDAFKARLKKRSKLLNTSAEGAPIDPNVLESVDLESDEDDVDMLLALINTMESRGARGRAGSTGVPMTVSEIVRLLQREKILSLEFAGTARAQTKRLLQKLREMNRAWQDAQGRWALL